MQANKRQMLFTCRAVARTARALVAALACAAIGNAVAADWQVWPETKDGMTGPQQITNALTRLSAGDTIRVNPGTYDFTGVWMHKYSKTVDGVTYTITNHLARKCDYNIVGVTDGHWDDAIVFKGDARCLDAHWANGVGNVDVRIRNITFDGFSAGNCPCNGSYESRGGALRLPDSVTAQDIISNCVFRNCRAYIAGAVNGGVLEDCLIANNQATYRGGASANTYIRNCHVLSNTAGGDYGAFYGETGLSGSLFEGNVCAGYGGAGLHASSRPVTNCVFRCNSSKSNSGGAICTSSKNPSDIVDCRFENNKAVNGGAIYQGTGDTVVPTRVRNCAFVGNSVSGKGGAIYNAKPSFVRPYETCVFSDNFSSAGGGAVYNGVYSNCTFVGNVSGDGSGGAARLASTGGVYRCTFIGNVVTNGEGGAFWTDRTGVQCPHLEGCTFTSNLVHSGAGGAVYRGILSNCVFTANVVSNGCGGAAVLVRSYGNAAWDCAFVGNVCWANSEKKENASGGAVYGNGACPFTRCVFTNNYAWNEGGALYRGVCTNCTFFGNRCVNTRGASLRGNYSYPQVFQDIAVNCRFIENYRQDNTGRYSSQHIEYQGGDVCCARMENCEVIGGAGSFWRCSMLNCNLHDFTNKLGHCVFGEENWVTNCLVYNARMDRKGMNYQSLFYRSHYYPDSPSIDYRGRERGEWVNCTFADNTLNKTYGMFSIQYYDTTYGPKMVADFKNCIFYNNRKTGDTLADISGYNAYDVTFSNCVYGASDGTLKYGSTVGWTDVGGTFVCKKPGFVALQGARHGIAHYTPRATSKVIGKGDATMFAEGAVDLAGNSRLTKDGKLDLGCYTHTDRNFGCSFLVK